MPMLYSPVYTTLSSYDRKFLLLAFDEETYSNRNRLGPISIQVFAANVVLIS